MIVLREFLSLKNDLQLLDGESVEEINMGDKCE